MHQQPTGSSSAISTILKLSDGHEIKMEKEFERYLFEQYLENDGGANWKIKAFYLLKPIIPRSVQLALRRGYKSVQATNSFPAWPVETILVDMLGQTLSMVCEESAEGTVYRISCWPGKNKFAFVITHDVEGERGLKIAPQLAEIEKDKGLVSSWNIVPERYPIDWGIVDALRSDGFEIGVHGLKHDGRLFESRKIFQERLIKIYGYAEKWGAVGFRSPATLRNLAWMHELKFEYDSSFFDSDPYEPQPGGCCSIWPYFIQDLVELPMTMPQDHTIFEILNHNDISVWKEKADWIESNGGMVLINVHPDCCDSSRRLELYEEFLDYMMAKDHMWNALPRDVARWWRDRSSSDVKRKNDTMTIVGPASQAGSVLKTQVDGGILVDTYV